MKCSFFQSSHCRSCELLDKSYAESIVIKQLQLEELFPLEKTAFKAPAMLENDCSGSRSKAKFAVFLEGDQITFGFTTKEGSGRALEACPLHSAGINGLLPVLKNYLNKYQIIPYDLKTKRGELKYLLISKSSEEFLVRFVLRSKESLDRLRKLSLEMSQEVPEVRVVTANIQPIHQAIIEGDEEIILTEQKVIIHHFDEFKLALGARSFFQVTPEIARRLYDTLSAEVRTDNPKSLIDLYCGVGAFSFYANRSCKDVIGVEISKEAIDCALESTLINNSKINFQAMDVEDYLKMNPRKFDAVLVNPPRRGLNLNIIDSIIKINPEFIYYSSCNAYTLQRDFLELKEHYQIKSLQLFDMFPFTTHFETLMCLKRK